MEKIQELKQDVTELETIMKQATRSKVKDILSIECRKLVTEIVKIEETLKTEKLPEAPVTTPAVNTSKRYQIRLNNYAWDQTSKLVKFYITLKNAQSLPSEAVHCTFTPKSLELTVTNLDGKDYIFTINKLLETIKPADSNWRVKPDLIIISAAKEVSQSWSHVTEAEKKSSDAKKMTGIDKNADPSDGLMSMMKNMYEQGDDEMKRTIAKAWTEGQNKQGKMM